MLPLLSSVSLPSFQIYNILIPPFIRNLSPLKATERRLVNWLGLSITPEDAARILPSIDFMSLTDLGMDLYPPYMAKVGNDVMVW